MPRFARAIQIDVPYHVVQRGNNQSDVFFDKSDREKYLSLLSKYALKYGLAVHAYCLMTNHVHIIAVPSQKTSLAKAIGITNFKYAQHVNDSYNRSGHLWQGRFYSCALEECHYIEAMLYTELNPVRAQMVNAAWEFPWSSANAHITGVDTSGLLDLRNWTKNSTPSSWRQALQEKTPDKFLCEIRTCTNVGRPFGSFEFISRIEKESGQRLQKLKPGRPRKSVTAPALQLSLL